MPDLVNIYFFHASCNLPGQLIYLIIFIWIGHDNENNNNRSIVRSLMLAH